MYKVFLGVVLFMTLVSTESKAQNDLVADDSASVYNLNKPDRIAWFNTVGMGMFVHFGVDAPLGIVISHALVGASDDFKERYFKELPTIFNPNKFDAKQLARTAKLAGMKYVMFTTKHHSGFCMWDTKTTDFDIMHTPYGKDLLKEYVDAVRAEGLGVGFYFSPEDFYFLWQHHLPIQRFFNQWTPSLKKEFDDYTRKQCTELMTRYGKIDLLFIDGEPKDVVKETCWKLQPDLIITRGAMQTPEQVLPGQRIASPWLSCITMGTAWQYQPTNERYKSGKQLIDLGIDARSKGGSLLLNVGPKADGSFSDEQYARLQEMGAWYFINHECIDSVNSWVVSKENNIYLTAKGDTTIYAIITDANQWKEGTRKEFVLHSVEATKDTKVEVLGQNSKEIEYKQEDVSCRYKKLTDGISISVVKAQRIYDDHLWPNAVVVKLTTIRPRFKEAPTLSTLDNERIGTQIILKGKIYYNKNEDKVTEASFWYRPYLGQVETLYAAPWKLLPKVKVNALTGEFIYKGNLLKTNMGYEYKANINYFGADIDGDTKILRGNP